MIPSSTAFQRAERWRLCGLSWSCPVQSSWVPYDKISANLKRAVLVSEDDIFFQHMGVRLDDMQKAWAKNSQLNQQGGKIKLTPDFGRFAGLADMLYQFTPHSLGIRCEEGGCGGKSSYSATGIISAIETLGFSQQKNIPVTLIGAAGAMGIDVLNYFIAQGYGETRKLQTSSILNPLSRVFISVQQAQWHHMSL